MSENRRAKRNQEKLRAKAEDKAKESFLAILLAMRRGPLAKRITMCRLLICGYTSSAKPWRERLWYYTCNAFAILCFVSPFILLGILIRRAM